MTTLSVQKKNALPGSLTSNTLYLITGADANLLDIYLTNNDASIVRHVITKSEISSLINTGITDYTFNSLVSFVNDVNNRLDYLQTNNDIIDVKPKIYELGAQPFPWDVPVGTKVLINNNFLQGNGKSKLPLEFINDGEVWVPYQEQILYSNQGSYGVPVATVTQDSGGAEKTFFSTGSWHKIPYQLMYNGLGIRVRGNFFKNDSDTAASTFRARLGQSSSYTSGDIIAAVTTSAAASHQIAFDVTARINVLGALTVGQFTTPGIQRLLTSNTIAGDSGSDRKSLFSTDKDNFVTLTTILANIGSSSAILRYSISLVP